MATRNVVLTEHQEELITSLVSAGRFQNASEVLREGLRLVERDQQVFEAKLEALRAAVKEGFDAVDAGDYIEIRSEADHEAFWSDVRAEAVRRIAERSREAI